MMCSRTVPRSRAVSSRSTALKASALTKCSATTAVASSSRPAPTAMPMPADSHTVAAGVSPCTAPRRVMMIPAPKKPTPETIWAATREGSKTIRPVARTSAKPYLLTSMINAADVPTIVWVRSPALLPWMVGSRPMSVVNPNAANSSTMWRTPCTSPPSRDVASQVCMLVNYPVFAISRRG